MLTASNAFMMAAAVAGTVAVGALAWRAFETQLPAPITEARQAPAAVPPASNTVPATPRTPEAPPPPATKAEVKPTPAPSNAPANSAPSNAPANSAAPPAAPVGLDPPRFDVVRVEPSGESVVAGQALPNATVMVMNNGVKVAEVKADANGTFAVVPPALPPGDHQLTLRYQVGTQERDSEQSVTVSVPARQSDKVVAALTAPNQPTTVLNEPRAAEGTLAIRTVEAGQEGAFFATGTAVAGSTVRLYLNGTFIADVRGAADGKWLLKVEKGMAAGHYEVRADMLEPTTSKVAARVEVPFDYPVQAAAGKPAAGRSDKPETAAAGPATPAPATQTATSSSSQQAAVTTEPATSGVAVVSEIQSVTVLRGDSLWRISRRVLGRGIRYTQIYEANSSQIRDPNRIWPGQVLVAPAKAD